ncbi:MAG: RidA family protein [Sphingobacteriaceae bacterium]|nr:MAG: RidA family protein [Pedobacter sp.]
MKTIIETPLAPAPIGPYSQAVKAGKMLFISGQIAINPTTNELANDGIQEETIRVMKNIAQILAEAGYQFSDIIKTTIFLSDMAHFSEVNAVYGSYFKENFPARETVAVLGLPKNVRVEISATAYKD